MFVKKVTGEGPIMIFGTKLTHANQLITKKILDGRWRPFAFRKKQSAETPTSTRGMMRSRGKPGEMAVEMATCTSSIEPTTTYTRFEKTTCRRKSISVDSLKPYSSTLLTLIVVK